MPTNVAGVGFILEILALRKLRQEDYWNLGYIRPSLKNKMKTTDTIEYYLAIFINSHARHVSLYL